MTRGIPDLYTGSLGGLRWRGRSRRLNRRESSTRPRCTRYSPRAAPSSGCGLAPGAGGALGGRPGARGGRRAGGRPGARGALGLMPGRRGSAVARRGTDVPRRTGHKRIRSDETGVVGVATPENRCKAAIPKVAWIGPHGVRVSLRARRSEWRSIPATCGMVPGVRVRGERVEQGSELSAGRISDATRDRGRAVPRRPRPGRSPGYRGSAPRRGPRSRCRAT
jgi:hypothetical protein